MLLLVTELVLRARRTTALFERDAVLLDRGGMRLRIPLTAIETVRTGGGSRRRVIEIVLTSADATPVVHTLSPPNATAATAFADAVNAALPVRDTVEPRADGATLVTTVPVPPRTERKDRWTTSRERRVQWAFGALFALGTALAAATGEWVFIVLWAASYTRRSTSSPRRRTRWSSGSPRCPTSCTALALTIWQCMGRCPLIRRTRGNPSPRAPARSSGKFVSAGRQCGSTTT
jgi:hypothetical protein